MLVFSEDMEQYVLCCGGWIAMPAKECCRWAIEFTCKAPPSLAEWQCCVLAGRADQINSLMFSQCVLHSGGSDLFDSGDKNGLQVVDC